MAQHDFDAFREDGSSRRAAQICQAIAELRPVAPQPVVIVGDDQGGRTRLLRAVVNHIRAASEKVILGYVSPDQFPEEVRALVRDPSAIERAEQAILLVDRLDAFTEGLEDLEALVRMFLENHHAVILTSTRHPNRLQNIGEGLRLALGNGQFVEISARPSTAQAGLSRGREPETEEEAAVDTREEVRRLRHLLDRAHKQIASVSSAERELRAELDMQRIANQDLKWRFKLAKKCAEGDRGQVQAMQEELRRARLALARVLGDPCKAGSESAAELPDAEGEPNHRATAAAREAEQLLAEMTQSCAGTREEIQHQAQWIEALETEKSALTREVRSLRERLEAVEGEHARARSEADALVVRTEELRNALDADREHLTQVEQDYQQQAAELGAARKQREQAAAEAAAAKALAKQLHSERDEAVAERDAVRAQLDSAIAKHELVSAAAGVWGPEPDRENPVEEEADALQDLVGLLKRVERVELEKSALVQELAEYREQLHANREELAAALAQRDELKQRVDSGAAECEALRGDLNAAKQAGDALSDELKQARASQRALEDTAESHQATAREAQQVREEMAVRATAAHEEAQQLAARIETLELEKSSLADETRGLHDQVRAAREDGARARDEVATLNGRVQGLLGELEAYRGRLAQSEEEHGTRVAQLEALLEQRTASAADVEAAQAQARHLQAKLDETAAQRDDFRGQFESKQAEHEVLAVVTKASREAEEALRADLRQAQAHQSELQAEVASLRAATQKVEELSARLESQEAEWEQRTAALTRQRDDALERLKTLEVELEATRQVLGRASVERAAATADHLSEGMRAADGGASGPPSVQRLDIRAFDAEGNKLRIGESLRAAGVLSQDQLDDALSTQDQGHRQRLGEILVDKGYADEDTILRALAGQLGVSFVRLREELIDPDIAHLLNSKIATMHHCVPIHATAEELTLAMADPMDLMAIDDVELATNRQVRVVATPARDIERAHVTYYGTQ